MSEPKAARSGNDDSSKSSSGSLLSASAQGASFLILLQIGTRALSFAVNQVLLRFLSPQTLGISTQLELYSISVLFFARESFRVALQRQPSTETERASDKQDDKPLPKGAIRADSQAGQTQAVVNISYISIFLGLLFAYAFGALYLRSAEQDVLDVPFLGESLRLYGVATFWELLAEPCFVVVQQKMQYKTRAAAEAIATLCRCLTCLAMTYFGRQTGTDVGVLPFALGQVSYGFALLFVYYWLTWNVAANGGFSLSTRRIAPTPGKQPDTYLFSMYSRSLLWLSATLFSQSALKHLLTQGDAFLIAILADLNDQGSYALASNYGSLVARMVFQPIEEAGRNLFAKLLSKSQSNSHDEDECNRAQIASDILSDVIKLYLLLSIVAAALGPTIAPILLRLVAGRQWVDSGAGEVLSTYCYYIPLLALNGITEAFVAVAASNRDLHIQSLWMFAFSLGFAGASFLFLRTFNLGAQGLVWANMVNMSLRIAWSGNFIQNDLRRRQASLNVNQLLPSLGSVAVGIATAGFMPRVRESLDGSSKDLVYGAGVALPLLLTMATFERSFLLACYGRLRGNPKSNKNAHTKRQ